jgi:hypothetical protein
MGALADQRRPPVPDSGEAGLEEQQAAQGDRVESER